MANEISTLTDLNGVTHDIEDSTARSAIQTLDGQAVKSVNGQTPTAGAVLIGAGNIGYDNTSSGMTADDLQEAVDELHTDLGTKANTADLAAVATSGSAADVSYDNTNSGLTADDVQEAVDELNGTLSSHTSNSTIHVTATDKANWNAKADDSVVVKSVNSVNPVTGNVTLNADNIPAEGYGNKSVSGNPITITDGTATTAKNLDVSLTPIQDLHGYENPWPEGGGKNLLKNTATSGRSGSVDFIVNADGSVTANIPSERVGNAWFPIATGINISAGSILSGGKDSSIFIQIIDSQGTLLYKNGATETTITEDLTNVTVRLGIYNDVRNQTYTFLPMIRTSGDATWEPYSNICPISGLSSVSVVRTGKNLFDANSSGCVTGYTILSNGTLAAAAHISVSDYVSVKGNTTLTLLTGAEEEGGYNRRIVCFDKNKNFLGTCVETTDGPTSEIAITGTTVAGTEYVRFPFVTNGSNQQLEIGSTATSYEPYNGSTATITLGQTVYQGTVDFDTGLVTVTHGIVDLGSKTYSVSGNLYYFSMPTDSADVVSGGIDGQCSNYQLYKGGYASQPNYSVTINNNSFGSTKVAFFKDPSGKTAAEFATAMDGQKLIYPLATPITYQLTPAQLTLLSGYNYITSNGTTISLDYYGSEATNVQAEIAEFETNLDRLAGSIAQIETSPATATHKVGDLIVWNSQLYRVTAAIAVGESLSVGTNVSATSVANLIKSTTWQNSSSVSITTGYNNALYFTNITLDSSYSDIDEILSVTMTDYGTMTDVLMFQIVNSSMIRVWSKTSQVMSILKLKILYIPK